MQKNWKDSLRNYAMIQRIIALALTLFVVFLFFPKEGLFRYEYQLNQPWKHDKLIAPFDFGVLKTAEEIEEERAEIADAQLPIYSIDHELNELMLHRLDEAWDQQIDTAGRCDSVRSWSIELFASWLELGIIPTPSEELEKSLTPFSPILIERYGKLEKSTYGEALLIPEVYDSLSAATVRLNDSLCGSLALSLIREQLANNAFPNDSLRQRILEASYSSIVNVEGKVNRGQAIIDRGEIVNEERYKMLESLKVEFNNRTMSITGFQWSIIGEMAVVAVLLGLLLLFIFLNEKRLFNDPRPATLALSLIGIAFIMSSVAYMSKSVSIYVIPIGIAPLLLRMFFDFRLSIFTLVVLVLIVALMTSNPMEYIIMQVSAISFATLYQSSSTKRSRMLGTALLVFVGYTVTYTALSVAQNGSLSGIETANYGWFAINGLLCTMVFPLIYVVEKIFGYVSETTLLELSDSNQPLLKDLAIKAPGTFQHSLQVANLAEKVADRIGGSTILLRTAALYHDIGKMSEPQFFIENQLPDNNPHDDLEPEESASIIINHVIHGIELAKKHNLPIDIIHFIQTHHGTSKVRYFHNLAMKKDPEISDAGFTYPGPKPSTKEQAILMMADSIEAASRSLKKYDHESLDQLVEGIVNHQLNDGQFEEAPVTFQDISTAKTVLKAALKGIFHQRISYD